MCANLLWEGLEELGLELFVEDVNKRLPTVTTIKVGLYFKYELVIQKKAT